MFLAFVSTALLQQTTFWLVGRRVRDVYPGELHSVRGVLSSACVCALSAATARYGGMVIGFPNLIQRQSLSYKWIVVIDGFLSFPLYLGTMLFIAEAAGTQEINKQVRFPVDHVSDYGVTGWETGAMQTGTKFTVVGAWIVAVLVHGMYTCIALTQTVVFQVKRDVIKAPSIHVVILFVQTLLLVSFGLFVRRRFMTLVERQRVLLAPCRDQRQIS